MAVAVIEHYDGIGLSTPLRKAIDDLKSEGILP